MLGETAAGLSALKSAFDMIKGLKDMSDATTRNAALIELQEKILSAQQAQQSLIAHVEALEKENSRLKDWDEDKKRYEMVQLGPNIVAYSVKNSARNGQPNHLLCPDCFANEKKSFFQQIIRGEHYDKYKCNTCSLEVGVEKGNPPSRAAGHDWSPFDDN